mmetsp:Transcript_11241/g.25206  ORF Transcript_11241/g.25206 Transcript_11241/m.25206 type:complete len:847 (+) Transcript_11241:377-2917(+)
MTDSSATTTTTAARTSTFASSSINARPEPAHPISSGKGSSDIRTRRTGRRRMVWQQKLLQQQQQQQQQKVQLDQQEMMRAPKGSLLESESFHGIPLLSPILISVNSRSYEPSGGSSVGTIQHEALDMSSAAAQLVGADFVSLLVRTGLPVNIVKLLLLRVKRRYIRRQQEGVGKHLRSGATYASSLGLATNNPIDIGGGTDRRAFFSTRHSRRSTRASVVNVTTPRNTSTRREPRGLKNHGQTCFLNSVLQALASSRPFLIYLERIVDQAIRMDELNYRLGVVANEGSGKSILSAHSAPYSTTAAGSGTEEDVLLSELLLDILLFINGLTTDDDTNHGSYRKKSLDVRELLRRVGEEHAQFRARAGGLSHIGTEQQDAQELLQALIGMIEAEGSASNTSFSGSKDVSSSNVLAEPCDGIDDISISVMSACHYEDQTTGEGCNTYDKVSLNKGLAVASDPNDEAVLTFSDILVQMGALQDRIEKASTVSSRRTDSFSFSRKEEKKDDEADNAFGLAHERPEDSGCILKSSVETANGAMVNAAVSSLPLSTPSPSVSPLTGWLGSTLQCRECKHVRISNVPFLEIPIIPTSIGTAGGDGFGHRNLSPSSPLPACSLFECLKDFTAAERVHDVECQSCSIKAELKHIDDEMTLLQGAVESVVSRSSKSSSGDNDVEGLQREMQTLEARRYRLKSADVDAIYNDIASDAESDDCSIGKADDALPPPCHSEARKCLLLSRPPPILCLHIQRRYYDASVDRMLKAMQIVLFDEVIDLSPFCAYITSGNTIAYRLLAVIEHRGNAHAGHYVTYRRVVSSIGKEWALVSDETVSYCSWDDVRRSQAYMLIYEAF